MTTETFRVICQLAALLMLFGGAAISIVAMIKSFPTLYGPESFPVKMVVLGSTLVAIGGFLGYMTASDGSWLQK